MRLSPAVSIEAIAACSAQKPSEHGVSRQMPLYIFPFSVISAAATLPHSESSVRLLAPATDSAAVISSSLIIPMTQLYHVPIRNIIQAWKHSQSNTPRSEGMENTFSKILRNEIVRKIDRNSFLYAMD